ncbi:MAG: succinylglutamate desuccinylase/aspartoacylase family protein [Gammaproteobacteria bacterium]|nr:succinylglutamate desuccinylase/aspartoacylase family protein [Gammaproteobacteria bacterium]
MRSLLFFLLCALSAAASAAERLEFTIHKLESGVPGPTVLVVGGIQGDEPGGFHAASMLVTHYRATRGSVWIVPNLNFDSIVERSRGVYGDMNRKFDHVPANDPDYDAVQRIKALITDEQVAFIFNMHDGSGFYRAEHTDWLHSPQRWGQSIVIDQEMLSVGQFANVGELSQTVVARLNANLLDDEHVYHVKNTRTREGNAEMAKTLTYFAINHGKAAVGLEASKTLSTAQRTFYHLSALEHFFEILGVSVEREFELDPQVVEAEIEDNIRIAFYRNKLLYDVANARSTIGYVPLQKGVDLEVEVSNPLIALKKKGGGYRVNYGNRNVTYLQPQYFEYDDSLASILMEVDGVLRQVDLGSVIEVRDAFQVIHLEDAYRVNVIGWSRHNVDNESNQEIRRGSIMRRFSVDEPGALFRVEVYRDQRFCGMVLVRFGDGDSTAPARNASRISVDEHGPLAAFDGEVFEIGGR